MKNLAPPRPASIPKPQQQPGFPSCIHLAVEFNGHAVFYETAEQWLENCGELVDWVSDEERDKALATDSVWTCQWYPTTPVGFCLVAASSFDALMAYVNRPDVDGGQAE
jgi:hypothetical protein